MGHLNAGHHTSSWLHWGGTGRVVVLPQGTPPGAGGDLISCPCTCSKGEQQCHQQGLQRGTFPSIRPSSTRPTVGPGPVIGPLACPSCTLPPTQSTTLLSALLVRGGRACCLPFKKLFSPLPTCTPHVTWNQPLRPPCWTGPSSPTHSFTPGHSASPACARKRGTRGGCPPVTVWRWERGD